MKHEYFVHKPLNILKITADPTLCKNCYNRPEICFKRPKEEPDPKGILYPFHMAVVQTPESLSITDIITATPRNDVLNWFSRCLAQVNISAAHIGLHYYNTVSKTIDRLVLNFEQMLPGERPFQFVFYGQTWLNDKNGVFPIEPIIVSIHKSRHDGSIITEIQTTQSASPFPLVSSLRDCEKILTFSTRHPYALQVVLNSADD